MAAPKKIDPAVQLEREQAWVGDAVLALYMRELILREDGIMDGEKFVRCTSNGFLRNIGNPTSVEARIGRIYQTEGLQAAFEWMEENLLPVFRTQEHNHHQRVANQGKRKKKR